MLRIAVVDDEADQRALIAEYLARFCAGAAREIDVDAYCNGFDFLSVFDSRYDAVFLDIQMPDMNGIQVAEEIRATDQRVKIVFITNLGQYAVQGYAVRAMDFIVKPLGLGELQRQNAAVLPRLRCRAAALHYHPQRRGNAALAYPTASCTPSW